MKKIKEKIKEFIEIHKKEIIFIIIIFLVSTISFAIGYLYAYEIRNTPIIIQKNINQ